MRTSSRLAVASLAFWPAKTLLAAALLIPAGAGAQEAGVVVAEVSLPAPGAAYHGGTHVFPDAEARLTCSSHGGFTASVAPPRAAGTSALAEYHATFTGELSLGPPADATNYAVEGRVHMAERLTFAELRGSELVLETELVVLDLQGAGMPAGILVRESPTRASIGRATITTLTRGRHRVESSYEVWLELSGDGGRSWIPADAAVRMTLVPAAARARMQVAPGR